METAKEFEVKRGIAGIVAAFEEEGDGLIGGIVATLEDEGGVLIIVGVVSFAISAFVSIIRMVRACASSISFSMSSTLHKARIFSLYSFRRFHF